MTDKTIKLYQSAGSPNSRRVRIFLAEKGLSTPDAARAVALFGDRLPESAFKIEVDREFLCQDEHLDALRELAEHIGIEQLFGL